jgi:hypothetical protein
VIRENEIVLFPVNQSLITSQLVECWQDGEEDHCKYRNDTDDGPEEFHFFATVHSNIDYADLKFQISLKILLSNRTWI